MNFLKRNAWYIGYVLLIVVFPAVMISEPHALGFHDYVWDGDGDFYADYAEARSRSLTGGRHAHVDYPTLNALMRSRGWELNCEVCGVAGGLSDR